MNIRYELMYKYICYIEENEKKALLQEVEKTNNKLDLEARLFIMNIVAKRFRQSQEDNYGKTNFYISFTTNGKQLLDKGYAKEFEKFSYCPDDILKYAVSIAGDYGIVAHYYMRDYYTEYDFSINLLDEKKTKQNHTQTLVRRGPNNNR